MRASTLKRNSLLFVGDIHLGKRFPYTTRTTQGRFCSLRSAILANLLSGEDTPLVKVQMGDLFDSFNPSANVLVEGFHIAGQFNAVLAGNHDMSKNTELTSGLQLLEELERPVLFKGAYSVPNPIANVVVVPSQTSQEQFEAQLVVANGMVKRGTMNVLLVHANNSDRGGSAAENYLTTELVSEVCAGFGLVVSGHEHNGGFRYGKLLYTGSVLPMSFGEMTEKFVVTMDERGEVSQVITWSPEGNYLSVNHADFLTIPINTPYQFIEITGEIMAGEAVALQRQIAKWYQESETLIAIKNDTVSQQFVEISEMDKATSSSDWKALVRSKLTADQVEAFNSLLGE